MPWKEACTLDERLHFVGESLNGKIVAVEAKELDLTDSAVRLWFKQTAFYSMRDQNGPLTNEERAELTHLQMGFKALAQEKAFL